MLFAECDPSCALQACLAIGNTGHFDNEIDFAARRAWTSSLIVSSFPASGRWVICCITPFALQMRRLKGFFALFPDFKKVRSSTASAEMTRQVEISTLSAHQMAHAGVVAHTSSWTPAASELEESSPPLDSHISSLPEAPDGKKGVKGQGYVHSDGSDRWQRRRVPGRCNKYWNRGLPRVASGPCCPPSPWSCTS